MRTIEEILNDHGIKVQEAIAIEGRDAVYAPVPSNLAPEVQHRLTAEYSSGLYLHQARALSLLLDGKDVCLETATASGKSAVFTAFGSHKTLENPSGLTLAVYPLKALIDDQYEKWVRFAEPLGIRVVKIYGETPVAQRLELLRDADVALITPDVVHAWLLANSADTSEHLRRIQLVILDEAHTYTGVFGTNMAYLLRRLRVFSPAYQVVVATATISDAADFVRTLIGGDIVSITKVDEGQPVAEKRVYLVTKDSRPTTERISNLLRTLALSYEGKFIAFVDSRLDAERLSVRVHAMDRTSKKVKHMNMIDDEDDVVSDETPDQRPEMQWVAADQVEIDTRDELDDLEIEDLKIEDVLVAYRAGYEHSDREEIQNALSKGKLRGVIATSALELGVDIGEVDLVLMLNTPPSMKSFWQRFGRAGRRGQVGHCLLIDTRGAVAAGGLHEYLSRPTEKNHIYLDNKYIMYTQVLCARAEAVDEHQAVAAWSAMPATPPEFIAALKNEISGAFGVDNELFTLRKSAMESYHSAFQMRSGIDDLFTIKYGRGRHKLGNITWAQVLREAYPEGYYYHKSKPYVVRAINYRTKEVHVEKSRYQTSRPKHQSMVFPDFTSASNYWKTDSGFLIQCDVQVTERVTGCIVKRGNERVDIEYNSSSPRQRKPLFRYLHSNGVLWSFNHGSEGAEHAARLLMETYCDVASIHKGEVAVGRFQASTSPNGGGVTRGLCVYDTVYGGLHLTDELYKRFRELVHITLDRHSADSQTPGLEALKALAKEVDDMVLNTITPWGAIEASNDDQWVTVVAQGERAIYLDGCNSAEVTIKEWAYTKNGVAYRFDIEGGTAVKSVAGHSILPLAGVSRMLRYNVQTGERVDL